MLRRCWDGWSKTIYEYIYESYMNQIWIIFAWFCMYLNYICHVTACLSFWYPETRLMGLHRGDVVWCCVKVRSSLSTWTTAGAFLRSHNSTLSLQVPSRSQSIQSRYGLGGVFAVLLVVPISVRFSTCFSNVSFWLLQSVRCGREMWWGWCHFRIHRDLWSMDVASMEDAALVQIDSLIDR